MKKDNGALIVDGMARSSVTFLARIIDAFPGYRVLVNPTTFFQAYVEDKVWPRDFSFPQSMLVREANFTLPPKRPDAFKNDLIKRMLCKKKVLELKMKAELLKYIRSIDSQDSFIEIFNNIVEVIRNYSKSTFVGIKIAQSHRLRDAMLDANPNLKWIAVTRNPYALYSSVKRTTFTSIKFTCKFWNDLIDSINNIPPRHKNRFLWVRYEDLVLSSHKTIALVARFLGIELDVNAFIKNLRLKDNLGKPWFSNTRYGYGYRKDTGVKAPYFDKRPLGKWKEELNFLEKQVIKALCGRNMARAGYKK